MINRKVKRIWKAQRINMGGIFLDQALPVESADQIDPFLLIHHWYEKYPSGGNQQNLGVGPHPHRGFAPVTMIFKGNVHHRDSLGFDSVVDAGGIQWMNSGSGIIHSERPGKVLAESGGEFEIIQFWVNAPRKNKLDAPHYQALHSADMPIVTSSDKKVRCGIVAGKFHDIKSPIQTYSEMLIMRMDFEPNGTVTIPVDSQFNALVYVLDGSLKAENDATVGNKQLICYENNGEVIILRSYQKTRAILLSGKPLNEPVSNYGPFVMNSQKELMEAIEDYQKGNMGQLHEEFN